MNLEEKSIERLKNTARIEAFSDGVFAIAITLLILDIHVPEFQQNETLMHALAHEWPAILALLIGFFTILICWINHHYMFSLIQQANSKLLLINGFKLLVVTTTPFATALLSKHLQTDWEAAAINIYALNFMFMGIAMTGIWHYALKQGFIKPVPREVLSCASRLYLFSSLFPVAIWIISFFSITGCLILSGIMFAIFIFPEKMVALQVKRRKIHSQSPSAEIT
jgi:uncharacterized membrane protein